MIHLNRGDKPHEFLTDEEFKAKYPALHERLNGPRPYNNSAYLQKRIKAGVVIRKFAKAAGVSAVEICDFELGFTEGTPEIKKAYMELEIPA